ncbi:MAG: DUF2238 domain-containing protein [Gammaproteobacteria bacterium]|nr:DUF2238 domain-containing protein [Gammaproteobacteria bacterium]
MTGKIESNDVNRKYKYVLIIFLIVFSIMEALALGLESHYKYDILMCLILLFATYYFRSHIYLHWIHYFLFSIFLFLHCCGMFQLYETYPLGIEYDYWVHSYFGLISSLIILHWFTKSDYKFSQTFCIISTFVAVLGISAAHELYEFAGAILLGEGDGVLFIGAGDKDQWDTQKDMLNNIIGGIVGVSFRFAFNKN